MQGVIHSVRFLGFLFQNLHRFSATAGNDLPFLYVQQLMTDGAVYIAFLFCTDNGLKTAFQFHFHIILTYQWILISMKCQVPTFTQEVVFPVKKL